MNAIETKSGLNETPHAAVVEMVSDDRYNGLQYISHIGCERAGDKILVRMGVGRFALYVGGRKTLCGVCDGVI